MHPACPCAFWRRRGFATAGPPSSDRALHGRECHPSAGCVCHRVGSARGELSSNVDPSGTLGNLEHGDAYVGAGRGPELSGLRTTSTVLPLRGWSACGTVWRVWVALAAVGGGYYERECRRSPKESRGLRCDCVNARWAAAPA